MKNDSTIILSLEEKNQIFSPSTTAKTTAAADKPHGCQEHRVHHSPTVFSVELFLIEFSFVLTSSLMDNSAFFKIHSYVKWGMRIISICQKYGDQMRQRGLTEDIISFPSIFPT